MTDIQLQLRCLSVEHRKWPRNSPWACLASPLRHTKAHPGPHGGPEVAIEYLGQPGADKQIPLQFYEFSTGTSGRLVKIEGRAYQGLGVSPDRKSFLFSKVVNSGVDLMLIENFR